VTISGPAARGRAERWARNGEVVARAARAAFLLIIENKGIFEILPS